MDKSAEAFRTISEVATLLETPAHVLRFWETRFPQIRPVKRAGGRRYYRPNDVALLTGIKHLLHAEGMTIRGVQKVLRDQGVRHVAGLAGAEISDIEMDAEAALNAALAANFADHPDVTGNIASPERAESATIIALETALTRGDGARSPAPEPSNVIELMDAAQGLAQGFDHLPEGETPTLPGFDFAPPQPSRPRIPPITTVAAATAALRPLPPLALQDSRAAQHALARARALHDRLSLNATAGAI